jgi:glycosyltransferase involved in cell wall biosynthesis
VLPKLLVGLDKLLNVRALQVIAPLAVPQLAKLKLVGSLPTDCGAIVVHHENIDAVYTGVVVGEEISAPKLVLLQLPPFYASKERVVNIAKSLVMWRKLLAGSKPQEVLYVAEAVAKINFVYEAGRRRLERLLKHYEVIVAVSKSIPYEMGGEWVNNVISMDPGVALDEEDLKIMKALRSSVKAKENYIVFGGRPSFEKGLAEALVAFSQVAKVHRDLKLVITGRVDEAKVIRACKRLGLDGKVMLAGFVPREERLRIVAGAKLMLYPSHVDAFPYAVLESLYLGTPVVGYKIPALEMYFGRQPGVRLVKEGDVEALVVEAANVLEKGIDAVEPPRLRSWEEIMEEEIGLINKLIKR